MRGNRQDWLRWVMVVGLVLPTAAPGQQEADTASPAERIARLKRTIERDQKYLRMYQAELADPLGEFQEVETRFKELDERWAQRQEQIDQLRETGQAAAAEQILQASAGLKAAWQRSRDSFNLEIQQRRVIQENIALLNDKIERDQAALKDLLDGDAPQPTTAPAAPGQPAPVQPPPGTPTSAANPPPGTANSATTISITSSGGGVDEQELQEARAEAQRREAAAAVARKRATAVQERLAVLRRSIALEEKLLETARQKVEQAEKSLGSLQERLEQKKAAGTAPADLDKLQGYLPQVEQRLANARDEVKTVTSRLRELRGEERVLMAELETAEREAVVKEHEAKSAGERIAELQNPFTVRNLLNWLLAHGPKILLILTGMLGFQRMVSLFTHRIAKVMASASGRGTVEERENRATTLISVFRNAANLAVIGGGLLMLFDEVGIPIVPLMGGAAVLGLAVAFGAQNLIRDYFSGFMVLLEDQYAIGDVVRIGSITGRVERISLRVTVLRDLEGILHFIPHGTISTVSNRTHSWSRTVLDIGVSYREDVDQVMSVLLELARDMARDPKYGPQIIAEPEMLGVDQFGDSAVTIKLAIKTKPLQQWPIKRELLRRIKKRFDELGIEIPFPHRTVYHRRVEETAHDKREAA